MTTTDLLALCGGLIERSPLAMAVTREETHEARFVNAAFRELTETAGEQLLDRPFAEAFPHSRTDGSLALLDRAWRTRRAARITEVEHRRPSGGTVFWSYIAWPILDDLNQPAALILEVRDATEQVNTRRAQAAVARQLRALNGRLIRPSAREQELAEAAERHAAQLNETRRQFVSFVSHDLRAPLSAILGYAELLAGFYETEHQNEQARAATAIVRSARQMDAMVDELLESTCLESGELVLNKRLEDLEFLVSVTIESIGSAKLRSRIGVDAEAAIPRLSVDPARLTRALMNLLVNALRYSPSDAPVTVRIERRGDEAVVSVTDFGAGIPPDELSRIFERFFRDRSVANAEGPGMGLYIARLTVEAHGGRIWAESDPGTGSTFSFALPLR